MKRFRVEAQRITDFYMIIEAESETAALMIARHGNGELVAKETVETHTTIDVFSAFELDK